jgi:hypothetical protein
MLMRLATILVVAMSLSGCGARDEPATNDAPPEVGGMLAVRPLVTGYEGMRTALESAVTAEPRVAGDSATWAEVWAGVDLQPPAPKLAFEREFGVVYGRSRSSCNEHRASIDSARFEGPNSVRIFVSDRSGGICLDTTSFTVVAAVVRWSPRWSTSPHVVAEVSDSP